MKPKAHEPVAAYLDAFQSFTQNGASGDPSWLKAMRQRAIEAFEAAGFPSSREEGWRFTNVSALTTDPFERTPVRRDDPASAATLEASLLGDPSWTRVVLVDGRYAPALSRPAHEDGVWAGSFHDALAGEHARVVERHLGRYAAVENEPFAALSTAFVRDGALVHIPAGVAVTHPIHIVCVSTGASGQVSYPRMLVVVEREARVTIIESHVNVGGGAYWTNTVAEGVIGDAADVQWFRVQNDGPEALHMATTQIYQGRDSRWFSCSLALGAKLARHNLRTELAGEGAHATMDGLYILGRNQHVDHHTTIDHATPHCTSHELFNGVIDDRARAVFTGRIIVRRGAQRTDSKQSNNNVLLTEDARAHSQPQLEIYADDVRCTHGATLGPIDETSMFYLRSRGHDVEEAKQLLTYGFAVEVLRHIKAPAIREALDALIRHQLGTALAGAT